MTGDSMFAYLGLLSAPAQVQSITAYRVTLKTSHRYAPGLRMISELVNDARTFKCIESLLAEGGQVHSDGTYIWDAELSRPLTVEELRCLAGHGVATR
jgi:hypothetical protein